MRGHRANRVDHCKYLSYFSIMYRSLQDRKALLCLWIRSVCSTTHDYVHDSKRWQLDPIGVPVGHGGIRIVFVQTKKNESLSSLDIGARHGFYGIRLAPFLAFLFLNSWPCPPKRFCQSLMISTNAHKVF